MQAHLYAQFRTGREYTRAESLCKHLVVKVTLREFWQALWGAEKTLLSLEEVTKHSPRKIGLRRLQVVQVDEIAGSIGHRQDFSVDFMPRRGVNRNRWMRVHIAFEQDEPLPPVELYQCGERYFVVDGHHRVSVARARGISELEAYVTQIEGTQIEGRPAPHCND